jgi:DNA-binding GntR family transcriptional regulator
LSQQIARILEQLIINQEIRVGAFAREIELADQFGASRRIIREAIAMLRDAAWWRSATEAALM